MPSIEPRTAALASLIVLAGIAGLFGLVAPRQPLPLTQLRPPAARPAATPSPHRTSRGGTRPPPPPASVTRPPAPLPHPAAGAARPAAPVPDPTAVVTRPATPGADPAGVVAEYYAALDARRFKAAWSTLAPPARARFRSFAAWRAGYATTLSNRPERIVVSRQGSRATVQLVLVATDRSACGPVHRSFTVRWSLVVVDGQWRAESLTAAPRGIAPPACPAR